ETIKIKNCLKSWHFSIDSRILLTTLNGNEKLLYITLCSYLSPSGDTCFPSIQRLTTQMSCSRRSVFRTLLELEEKGIVIRHEQFDKNGRRLVTLYEIHEIPEEFYIQPEPEKPEKPVKPEKREIKAICESGKPETTPQIETAGGAGAGGCQTDTGGGCQNGTGVVPNWHGDSANLAHNHLPIEHIPKEIKDKDTPPVGRSAGRGKSETPVLERESQKPEDSQKLQNIQKSVPKYLNEVAEYFLLKTGRDQLTYSEIDILAALGETLAIPRINREISVAAERFKAQGKSLKLLKMNYIQEALKYQSSTKRKPATQIENKAPETHGFTLDDVLRAYQLGGEDPEDLPTLCEMYRIPEEETIEVYKACGVNKYPNGEAE
ncbi:MAG: helix-turn-helix domain-containing protein, partial [Synergistaceae bacterium]|nr:helix-turn-helix domain-containing protein [Synergistaceae bacterium]